MITKKISCLFIFTVILSEAKSQQSQNKILGSNIIGCWQTERYISANKTVEFPPTVIMQYHFDCNNSYTYTISNKETGDKKFQSGVFIIDRDSILLDCDGNRQHLSKIYLSVNSLSFHVSIEGQKGIFYLKKILCE